MERRRNARRVRHVAVRFYRRGESQAQPGSTIDISPTGMFVTTQSPLPPGERVRVEVLGEHGFMVEGVVARAMKVATHLQAIKKPGMGIRFLAVEELVAELLTRGAGLRVDAAAKPADVEPEPQNGVYPVRFRDHEHFVQTFRRDIATGGLFVSTRHPARLNESVVVELHLPDSGREPLQLRARVVQRFEPQATSGGANLMSGMGVELVDRQGAIALLEPLLDKPQASS